MSELLPCPFCGGVARVYGEEKSGYFVGCDTCFSDSDIRDTKYEAIAAWNTRHERECHITDYRGNYGMCDHCGAWVSGVAWTDCTESHKVWHCPNCGREVM